jgi:regulator of protease activity HflC (stomatin/prohibitin superfamily)
MNYAPSPFGDPVGLAGRIVVPQWGTALLFRDGAVVERLGPGVHRRIGHRVSTRFVDLRPWILEVPVQEVPTADALTVKASVAVSLQVADPEAWVSAVQEPHAVVYLRVQIALREVVARVTLAELLATRADVGAAVTEAIGTLEDIGLTVQRLDLKDVVLPGEIKRAQAAVAIAKAEGEAMLERSRAETAALRGLANAARLATETPALVELRLLQELGRTTGHTVVLGPRPQPS